MSSGSPPEALLASCPAAARPPPALAAAGPTSWVNSIALAFSSGVYLRGVVDALFLPAITDLLRDDFTMPRMDGEQCCRELRRLDSRILLFVSSGRALDSQSGTMAHLGVAGTIGKPYRMETLRDALARTFETVS